MKHYRYITVGTTTEHAVLDIKYRWQHINESKLLHMYVRTSNERFFCDKSIFKRLNMASIVQYDMDKKE